MNSTAETLSIVAAIATACQLGALLLLHKLPTGYSPVSNAVSDYGVGRFRAVFWAQALAGAVAGIALALALLQLSPFKPTVVAVALIVSSIARVFLPFFPTDQGGSRFQTTSGTVHMLLAFASFGGIVVAATSLWSTLEHYPEWHELKSDLTILPWVVLGSAVALLLALRPERMLHPILGVLERLFYVSSITWFFIVAIELARLS